MLCSKADFSFSNKISDSFLRLKRVLFLSWSEAISARALINSCFMRRDSHGEVMGAENTTFLLITIKVFIIYMFKHTEYRFL